MTSFTSTLRLFFTERLARQRQASGHTIAAYRDTFRLLLCFTQDRTGNNRPPWTGATSTPRCPD